MKPRLPRTNDLKDIQAAFEDIYRKIDFIKEGGNIDMSGRRFMNVGDAITPGEFVTKRQWQKLYDEELAKLQQVDADVDTTVPTLVGGTLTVEATGPFVALITVEAPTGKPTGWLNVTRMNLEVYSDVGLSTLVYSAVHEGGRLKKVQFTCAVGAEGGTFYARWKATNEIGSSAWSSATEFSLEGVGGLGSDSDVPSAPYTAVVGELMNDGAVRFTFGAEIPATNAITAYKTQFQIATNSGFTDSVFDWEGGCPDNLVWIATSIQAYYFRARTKNVVGWSDWSTTIEKQANDLIEGLDTDVPGAPQNVTLVSDDVDASVPGNELVIEFDRPLTNYNTLFAYAVQVHDQASFPEHAVLYSGAGNCNRGGFVLTDNEKSFPSSVVGKNLWIHSGTPMTEANLVSTGEIISSTPTTVTINDPIRHGGTAVHYQIIVGDWTQVIRSIDVLTGILDPSVQNNRHFRVVVRGLEQSSSYYVRVKGANRYGVGSWCTPAGPITLDGIKTADIKEGAITYSLFQTGLEPVQVVSSLPGTGTQGQVVYLTTDNKLYRYTGSAWTAAVPAVDITGTITETQITDGAISTPKLQANAVVTAKLAAGAVTANEIAANAVITDKIQAGAVTAAKMSVSQLDAISANVGTLTSGTITGLVVQTGTSGLRAFMSPVGLKAIASDESVIFETASGGYGSGIFAKNAYIGNQLDVVANCNIGGVLGVTGNCSIWGVYKVDDTQVVGNRITGWSAPTGTASRATFATSTVTLEELAQRVKALIDDLMTHGLIGA